MTTLAAIERRPVPAPATAELRPEDFASDWPEKPVVPVLVGLRLPSEDDVQIVRKGADEATAALALSDPESAAHAFNDAVMARGVARSICSEHNVLEAHPVLPLAEDTITQALTSRAIRRLYDALERLQVEQSPLAPEASDDELAELSDRIVCGDPLELAPAEAATFRRFARYMLDLLPPLE